MEEHDDPPVSHDHTLGCPFYHPPAGEVLPDIVPVVPQDRMDDTEELPHHGNKRPHSHHAPAGEPLIVVMHDPVLSDHLDGGKVKDLSDEAPPPLRDPLLSFSLPRAHLVEVEAGELDDLRLTS